MGTSPSAITEPEGGTTNSSETCTSFAHHRAGRTDRTNHHRALGGQRSLPSSWFIFLEVYFHPDWKNIRTPSITGEHRNRGYPARCAPVRLHPMASGKRSRAWGRKRRRRGAAGVHRVRAGDEGDAQPETLAMASSYPPLPIFCGEPRYEQPGE